MSDPAKSIFTQLSRINFDHADRDDPQQVFMETLEVVATATKLKLTSVFGQSAFNETFFRQIEKFAAQNRLHTLRTPTVPVGTQLLALTSLGIPRAILAQDHENRTSSPSAKNSECLLWLLSERSENLLSRIQDAGSGKTLLGDVLRYPACCTVEYLRLEERHIEIAVDFYRKHHAARSDAELLRLLQEDNPLTGFHAEEEAKTARKLTRQQAHSIRRFPFNHFIACEECMGSQDSPAARLNESMAALASNLSNIFARKFTNYATSYFKMFQDQTGDA